MDYTNCKLYNIKSKKSLMYIIKIRDKKYYNQSLIAKEYNVFIDERLKPRLVEAPSYELKQIQRSIKLQLNQIKVPDYVFSGVKGKSYYDNALIHKGNRYVYKIDLTAFFPCIHRDYVYLFFINELNTSPDIANILTNLTTVDLTLCSIKNVQKVETFYMQKKLRNSNHLATGSPTSPILSYLVNKPMFNEIYDLSSKNNIVMTIYADDVTFSSIDKISYQFKTIVNKIVTKYHYKISKPKVKSYTKHYPKLITGVVLDRNGNPVPRNSMRLKVKLEIAELKLHPEKSKKRLQGLLTAIRQVNPGQYKNLYKFSKE